MGEPICSCCGYWVATDGDLCEACVDWACLIERATDAAGDHERWTNPPRRAA